VHAGVPVLPVAHNAGELWGKKQFLKHAGTITVTIGEPIVSADRNAADILRQAEDWIESAINGTMPAARDR